MRKIRHVFEVHVFIDSEEERQKVIRFLKVSMKCYSMLTGTTVEFLAAGKTTYVAGEQKGEDSAN